MALVPFAQASDLTTLEPSVDDASAQVAVDLVSAAIRASIGWDVDRAVDVTYTRVVPRRDRAFSANIWSIVLPTTHLTAVSAVTVDGVATTDYDWITSGIVYLGSPASRSVGVTYTGGWVRSPADQAPAVFRTVAVEYALRMANNPSGVRSYQLGNAQETFDFNTLKAELDEDCRLDAYRVNL